MLNERGNQNLGRREPLSGREALRLLTGAFDFAWELSPEKLPTTIDLTGIEELFRRHLAFDGDALYSEDALLFAFEFDTLTQPLRRLNLALHGQIRLPAGPNGVTSPTAVLSIQAAPPQTTPSLPKTFTKAWADIDDPEHFVYWDDIQFSDFVALRRELECANDERSIHRFLASRPVLLVQSITGGHGRWVYSHSWLGRMHEIDFLVAVRHSYGYEWTSIELEPSNARPFNKDGKPSKRLNEALHQVRTWRAWLRLNLDHARRSPDQRGLGLRDISPRCQSIVLLGRHWDYAPRDDEYRRLLRDEDGISLHSYDWLLRESLDRIRALGLITIELEPLASLPSCNSSRAERV